MGLIMTHEAIARKVMDVQNEFLKRIHHKTKNQICASTPHLLKLIFQCDDALMKFGFGEFGSHFLNSVKSLDLEHPEVSQVFDGIFQDESVFGNSLIEFLSLVQYAKDSQMNNLFPNLGEVYVKQNFDKNLFKKIDAKNCNKYHIRLLKDDEERYNLRLCKKMQVIDLQSVYKKGNEIWSSQPDDFASFLRFDSAYNSEIVKAERKMRRYQEIGCSTLATEINKSIQTFIETMEQSYYGFNRITMTNAAIILAKLHGFIFASSQHINAGGFQTYTDPQIYVERIFFSGYNFDPTSVLISTAYSSGTYRHIYEPKVYPFYELKTLASDKTLEIIDYLEKFPEANQKPIFDHYGVIVPSIKYNLNYISNGEGIIQNFTDTSDACRTLDKILIEKKIIHPVIVGERDGKCFFICHWE